MSNTDRVSKLRKVFTELRGELEERARYAGAPVGVRRKFRSLVSLAGTRATKRVIADLQDVMAQEGVFANPPINGDLPSLDSWIELSLEPATDELALFAREKDLVAFVEHTLGVGVFRSLVPFTHGTTGSAREYRLPDHRRIDLLCEERTFRGRGALVAVELKRAHDRGAVEQMIGYLKALQQQFPARTVRGIIIAGKADETACEMLRAVTEFQIELVVYEVRFSSVTASFPRVSEN